MYQSISITKESIRNNVNAPTMVLSADIFAASIEPNVYFFILQNYHNYVYLITHHLNYMLKAQFRELFCMTESAARHRFKKLIKDESNENGDFCILGKLNYKGSHCIFPVHRAFEYSKINFPNEKKKRLDYSPKESTLLRGIMQTEYWLQFGDLMTENLEFFPSYFLKELNREEPFDYNLKSFFWMIEELEGKYVEFAKKIKESKRIIDMEVPEVDIEQLKAERLEGIPRDNSGGLIFAFDVGEEQELENENKFENRFKKASNEAKTQYVSNVARAAFETLTKSDVYVTRVVDLEPKKFFDPAIEIHIVVYHLPNSGASRYNSIIEALQRVTCFQHISVKLKINVVAYSDKTKEEARYAWKQAVKRRTERKDKVNLEARAKRSFKKLEKNQAMVGITKGDFLKYCRTSTNYCDEVEFINLAIDRYFTHYIDMSEDFNVGDAEWS